MIMKCDGKLVSKNSWYLSGYQTGNVECFHVEDRKMEASDKMTQMALKFVLK